MMQLHCTSTLAPSACCRLPMLLLLLSALNAACSSRFQVACTMCMPPETFTCGEEKQRDMLEMPLQLQQSSLVSPFIHWLTSTLTGRLAQHVHCHRTALRQRSFHAGASWWADGWEMPGKGCIGCWEVRHAEQVQVHEDCTAQVHPMSLEACGRLEMKHVCRPCCLLAWGAACPAAVHVVCPSVVAGCPELAVGQHAICESLQEWQALCVSFLPPLLLPASQSNTAAWQCTGTRGRRARQSRITVTSPNHAPIISC